MRYPIRALVLTLGVTAAVLAAPIAAQTSTCRGTVYNCFVLRTAAADLATVVSLHGLTQVETVKPGDPVVVMVTGPALILPEVTLELVAADPLVIAFELVAMTAITENADGPVANSADPTFRADLGATGAYAGPEAPYFAASLWNGYIRQSAALHIKLPETHALPDPEAMGSGVVAIIDTGVDPLHPLLQGSLVPGYDFLLEQAGIPSEWDALDPVVNAGTESNLRATANQSYTPIVEGRGVTVSKGPAAEAIVEQSYTPIVEGEQLPGAFGHGTMVAGIVRLLAPGALIMPLRVFDGEGTANLADVIQAIYYAVDHGANVINMSFSTGGYSQELFRAIHYAKKNGVITVSSSGNAGSEVLTYPAAFGKTLGVASLAPDGLRSGFSNYGGEMIALAAPGEGIITTYPGGLYAAAWGTSFSAAFISGAAALLHDLKGTVHVPIKVGQAEEVFTATANRTGLSAGSADEIGAGRLDLLSAFRCGLTFKLVCL